MDPQKCMHQFPTPLMRSCILKNVFSLIKCTLHTRNHSQPEVISNQVVHCVCWAVKTDALDNDDCPVDQLPFWSNLADKSTALKKSYVLHWPGHSDYVSFFQEIYDKKASQSEKHEAISEYLRLHSSLMNAMWKFEYLRVLESSASPA